MLAFPLNSERIIHSLKTALACLLALILGKVLHFGAEQWLVITILVVMCAQINVGGVLQKSYMRFLGTLIGSIIAVISLYYFGTNLTTTAIVIAFSAIVFSYIATGQNKFNDAGTLGAVTVIIILLGQKPTLITAVERFAEISLGIILAGLISQFVLPIHASTHLRNSQAETLRQLRAYYLIALGIEPVAKTDNNYSELDEVIAKSLISQRKLAIDAAREPLGEHFNIGHFNQYLWFAKEMLRSISFMHQIYNTSEECKKIFSSANQFHLAIAQALADTATGIDKHNLRTHVILIPSIQPLKENMPAEKDLSTEDTMYENAFLFCAEILTTHLEKMITLIKEFD